MDEKEVKRAGAELKAASRDTENASVWVGGELKSAASAAAGDTRAAGDKLEAGGAWSRDELVKAFDAVGGAINTLGKKIGSDKEVAPFDVSARESTSKPSKPQTAGKRRPPGEGKSRRSNS